MKLGKTFAKVVHAALPFTNPKANLSLQAAKAALPVAQRFQQQNPGASRLLMQGAGAPGFGSQPPVNSPAPFDFGANNAMRFAPASYGGAPPSPYGGNSSRSQYLWGR